MAGERFDEIKRWCDDFCDQYGTAGENGPAHVVVSDYNFEDEFVEHCIEAITERQGGGSLSSPRTIETSPHLEAARLLLVKIAAIPESERLPDED
jgi:hypothetical protein